jgi:hypothetical protein
VVAPNSTHRAQTTPAKRNKVVTNVGFEAFSMLAQIQRE